MTLAFKSPRIRYDHAPYYLQGARLRTRIPGADAPGYPPAAPAGLHLAARESRGLAPPATLRPPLRGFTWPHASFATRNN